MVEESYSTQRLDHPGIVAGICQQIGLVEQSATSQQDDLGVESQTYSSTCSRLTGTRGEKTLHP